MTKNTIKVNNKKEILRIQLYRPEANNTINSILIEELITTLESADNEEAIKIVILEGLPEIFCFGADFKQIASATDKAFYQGIEEGHYYRLLEQISQGSYISIASVRGKVNAGGVGIVSACDLVAADFTASFSLSELLFGLLPAQVMPLLIRRIGFQHAYRMTILTQPVNAKTAYRWGLIDEIDEIVTEPVRKMILRCKHLKKRHIQTLKSFMKPFWQDSIELKDHAIETASRLFNDVSIQKGIKNFIKNVLDIRIST